MSRTKLFKATNNDNKNCYVGTRKQLSSDLGITVSTLTYCLMYSRITKNGYTIEEIYADGTTVVDDEDRPMTDEEWKDFIDRYYGVVKLFY